MDLKKTGLAVLLFVLVTTAAVLGQLSVCVEFITTDNIGQMAASNYIPQSDYTYRFVNGASDVSDGSDYAAVRNAFSTWIDLPSSDLSVTETSKSVSFTPGTRNGYNDISWIGSGYGYNDPWSDLLSFSNSALAVVVTWYSSYSGIVRERDLYFNDVDYSWRTDSDGVQVGGFYVEDIALHEIGHIYGLKDVYNPGQPGWQAWMGSNNNYLTMYGYSSWTNEDVMLSDIDILAMADLHPSAVPEPNAAIMFAMAGGILIFVRKP